MKKIGFIISVLIVLGIFSLFFYFYQINYPLAKEGDEVSFVIESGQSPQKIAEALEDQEIIKSSFWLRCYLKTNDLASKIIAGTFSLSPKMSISQIARKITSENILSVEKQIKITEGQNNKQIADYLDECTVCVSAYFLNLVKSNDFDFEFLDSRPHGFDLEGFLFPDTYQIYEDADCENIIYKMLDNFDQKLDKQMRQDIEDQDKTIWEIITMASIIEKEAPIDYINNEYADAKIISGIFWDRIKNKQALQSCATLAYILGENKDQYSVEDTQIDSSYNTYRHLGLPPGPITNPGILAIKAAIYPTYTDYNYFLSDPKTGDTIWSKTFEEHKQNKWKYLN